MNINSTLLMIFSISLISIITLLCIYIIRLKSKLKEVICESKRMVSQINSNIEELEDKNIKLKSILKSISNGVVALDNDGRILLINDVAQEFFECSETDLYGIEIGIAIKNTRLLGSIKEIIKLKKRVVVEVEDKNRNFYKIKVDPIYLQDNDETIIGSIINIEDITESVKFEKIRTDFVANVTHELKTPLTSINGFVETLKNHENIATSDRNRFLDIIEMESDRLRRLIDDILILSFIENNRNDKTERVSINETFIEVYDLTLNLAKNKNIEYEYEMPKEDVMVNINKDYIKQILINLIDNAIKYTPENKKIKVVISDLAEDIEIKVIDNGMGIPKKEIPRIFQRFYRVDKARSRKIGGTGLGLAIVKHVLISLNGKITVNSKVNEGSEFIVTLPK